MYFILYIGFSFSWNYFLEWDYYGYSKFLREYLQLTGELKSYQKPRKIYVKNILWFRHLTNILNMLQGLYIFLIFVCKRNVFEAISKMRKGSQTLTGLNLLRSKNKGPSATIMTRMSKLTSSFHRSSGPNTDPNVI